MSSPTSTGTARSWSRPPLNRIERSLPLSRRQQLAQAAIEALRCLVLDPMAGAFENLEAGLRLELPELRSALCQIRNGGRVELTPNSREPALKAQQALGERAGMGDVLAADARALGIYFLHMHRERIDLGPIVDHQDAEIVLMRSRLLGFGPEPPPGLQRLHRAARRPGAGGADQHQGLGACAGVPDHIAGDQ